MFTLSTENQTNVYITIVFLIIYQTPSLLMSFLSMYDIEDNKHHIHIINNLLNYRQHQHIRLSEKKQELYYKN